MQPIPSCCSCTLTEYSPSSTTPLQPRTRPPFLLLPSPAQWNHLDAYAVHCGVPVKTVLDMASTTSSMSTLYVTRGNLSACGVLRTKQVTNARQRNTAVNKFTARRAR
ncbi:unnamed protein product [Ectocarpus sp. 13 AM-2016]